MKPLRVIHLVNNFPPEFRGGVERYLSELVLLQRAAGLEVMVITGSEVRDDAVAMKKESWEGVPVRRVLRRNDELYGVEFLPQRAMAAIRDEVTARTPDLVHLHHWFNLGDELLHQLAPLPAVATFHDAYSACPRFFFLRPDGFFCGSDLPVPVQRCVDCVQPDDGNADLADRIAARRARFAREISRLRVALAPSEYHADLLVRAGIVPSEKMRALPLGLARLPARPDHVPDKDGRLRLVTFGNLSRIKGVDLLLEALRSLARSGNVELHCYGDPLASDADLIAEGAGLPVIWHGAYELADLAAAAGAFDLAVFPSRAHETFSMVVEEAIALGLPPVVSDRGAPPRRLRTGARSVPGAATTFGRIVPVEDARALRATLSELMEHPEQIESMRRALPERPHLLADHERALRAIYAEIVA